MTARIVIGEHTVKPTSVKWKSSVLGFIDTCTITLPLITYVENNLRQTDTIEEKDYSKVIFKEGDKVEVWLGYDKNDTLRFKGFLKAINVTTPLTLECEGYSYQLIKKLFDKSYRATTVKQLLTDVVQGTDIKIHEKIPHIPLTAIRFPKGNNGISVLEWLKEKVQLAVYFDFDRLYAGFDFGIKGKTEKIRIGYNTVSDKEFKRKTTDTLTVVQLITKDSKGEVKKTMSDNGKYKQVKQVKIIPGLPDAFMKEIANRIQREDNYEGYQGNITCFLEPELKKSDVVELSDTRFKERSGFFFVEDIEGSFDSNGGRQKVSLKYFADKRKEPSLALMVQEYQA